MRRRRERTPREKVAAAAAPEEEARNVARKGEQGAEEYQCSGLLEQDLAELCARAGIAAVPAVTPRPSPADPAAAEGEEPAGPETHTQRRHGHIQRCVQVETEHDDPQSVREVFVRGWNIEEEMLGVLGKCLPALAHLRAVHLWRAGLTDRLLPALTTLLARCPGLGTLSLEGNPLPEHSFHLLMGPGSTLSHLSLRNNGIGDEAARLIGQSLSTLSSSNRSLVSLVLSFNHISDVGAGHIAQGLRWNRSLLSLSLAHNDIGDVGALRLAEVLGPFALTHAEVVERRRLLLAEALGQPQAQAEARSEHAPSLQGSAAAERLPPAKHNKGTAKKKELLRKDDLKQPKKPTTAPADPRPTRGRGAKAASKEKRSAEAQDPAEPSHPLLEPAWHRRGQLILPGNRALLNLNLAHNHITERGLGAFLAVLEGQQEEQPGGAAGRPGVLRLSLQRNGFPPTCEAFARLQELLQQRDPVPKPRGREEEQGAAP
ncbi:leucine-rich repeat-containing protein 71 isoform X3 [Cygnus olor]|uniref:leucine-rich repeat-containing protein 71 isoform X3 n=1 Tax=Cygnus olor TaxID=8869 RepID=UPI001ADE777B|nr:leucine-rich repeat-containing protein 71 isoform X3 [Cygnus olor]